MKEELTKEIEQMRLITKIKELYGILDFLNSLDKDKIDKDKKQSALYEKYTKQLKILILVLESKVENKEDLDDEDILPFY